MQISINKMKLKKVKLQRVFTYLLLAALALLILYYLNKFSILMDTYGIEAILTENKSIAMLIYFSICFLQPIVLPLPEPVTLMAGSSVFGPATGAFLGFSGTILGILTMFYLGRLASHKFINRFIDESKLLKFNKFIEKNEALMLLGLFILPILPDEIICIGAGLGRINPYKFIIVAIVSKLITSISLSYSLSLFNISFSTIISIFISLAIIYLLFKWLYKVVKNQ